MLPTDDVFPESAWNRSPHKSERSVLGTMGSLTDSNPPLCLSSVWTLLCENRCEKKESHYTLIFSVLNCFQIIPSNSFKMRSMLVCPCEGMSAAQSRKLGMEQQYPVTFCHSCCSWCALYRTPWRGQWRSVCNPKSSCIFVQISQVGLTWSLYI